jgi:hypothetical protein
MNRSPGICIPLTPAAHSLILQARAFGRRERFLCLATRVRLVAGSRDRRLIDNLLEGSGWEFA